MTRPRIAGSIIAGALTLALAAPHAQTDTSGHHDRQGGDGLFNCFAER